MQRVSHTILLLRMSRFGVPDPLAELDNVIARRETGWFGKVGREVSEKLITRMGGIPMPVLILVLHNPPGSQQLASDTRVPTLFCST